MEISVEREINGRKIVINITRELMDDTSYGDGQRFFYGKKTFETTTIIVERGGKKIICKDVFYFRIVKGDSFYDHATKNDDRIYARLGDKYISESVYNDVKSVLDEAMEIADRDIPAEYIEVKKIEEKRKYDAENNLKMKAAYQDEQKNHLGYCERCGTYCYGDCIATGES